VLMRSGLAREISSGWHDSSGSGLEHFRACGRTTDRTNWLKFL
jgi:hypothetical protein